MSGLAMVSILMRRNSYPHIMTFNTVECEEYIKLTNKTEHHNNHQYCYGLNVCKDFSLNSVGGFYFCKPDNAHEWIWYNKNGPMFWYRPVRLLEDSIVVQVSSTVYKTDKFVLGYRQPIMDCMTYEQHLRALVVWQPLIFQLHEPTQDHIDIVMNRRHSILS